MHTLQQRRDFLKATGIAGVGSMAWGLGALAGAAETSARTTARLLPGCCAYSYSSYFQQGRMTMEDFIVRAGELGVLGVDITTYWLNSTDPPYLARLRRFAYKQAVPLSGLAIGADLCQPDAAKRQETIEGVKKWVDATERLGAAHLRVFGDRLPIGATDDQGVGWVAETMKPACEYAAAKGVILGIETHSGLSVKPGQVVEILRRVDSPFAGCNLDIANFPDQPYDRIAECIPFASHVHVRDFYGPNRTPLDLERVWQLLVKGGYKGFVSAEYEGEEDPMTGVPKLLTKIKTLCREHSIA